MHYYILPKIVLQPINLNYVKNPLKVQKKSISQLEDVTIMHSRLLISQQAITCSKSTIEIVNSEHISHLFLVFLLLSLNK